MIKINISIIIALVSLIISFLSLLVADYRDRNKMAIHVINLFNSSVVLQLRKINNGNVDNETEYYYSALKSITQLYAYIDCGLANKRLVDKYLKPDLLFVSRELRIVVKGFLQNDTFKPIVFRYLKVMNHFNFSNHQLIINGDV